MVDSSFAELTTAPEDTSLYDWEWPLLMAATYVIRTGERPLRQVSHSRSDEYPRLSTCISPTVAESSRNGAPTGIAEQITTWVGEGVV